MEVSFKKNMIDRCENLFLHKVFFLKRHKGFLIKHSKDIFSICCRIFLHLIVLQRAARIASQRIRKSPSFCYSVQVRWIRTHSLNPTLCVYHLTQLVAILPPLRDGVWVSACYQSISFFFFLQKYNPVRIEWNMLKAGIFSFYRSSTKNFPHPRSLFREFRKFDAKQEWSQKSWIGRNILTKNRFFQKKVTATHCRSLALIGPVIRAQIIRKSDSPARSTKRSVCGRERGISGCSERVLEEH